MAALRATPSLVPSLVLTAADDERKARLNETIKKIPLEKRKQFETDQAAFEAATQVSVVEARKAVASLGALEPTISLDKSWYVLHYLFTGHVGPASAPGDFLLTGEEIGEDLGYGPARLHSEAATRDLRRFLDGQDLERLQSRIDLNEMRRQRIYALPLGPGSETEYKNELRADVALYFGLLRDYVRQISDKGDGLLVWFQ